MEAQKIPSITTEMLDRLKRAFNPIEVTPDTSINEIMFSAGHQQVITWLERHKRDSELSGDVNVTRMLR